MNINQKNTNMNDLPTEDEIEQEAQSRFGGLLSIYKVARAEDRKLLCIASMFFLIIYIYSVSKDLKDAFVIARQAPASISVLKVFWVPPTATVFSLLVQKLSVRMKNETILRLFLVVYVIYFLAYGIIVPPFRDSGVEIDKMHTIDLLSDGKMGFKDFIAFAASIMTFTAWTGTLHFIASEVWGSIILNLLFMQLFNEVCPEKQFKRFIPVVYFFSNIGLLGSSFTSYGIHVLIDIIEYKFRWYFFTFIFILLGCATIGVIFIQRYLINTVNSVPICRYVDKKHKKPSKEKIGFVEGLKMVFSTNVIVALCIMVFGYNITVIMNESAYKSCQHEVAVERKKSKEGSVLFNKCIEECITAVLVMSFFFFPTRNAIKWIGWTKYALIIPIGACIVSLAVLGLALLTTGARGQNLSWINILCRNSFLSKDNISKNIIIIEQYCGVIGTAMMKVMKYIIFDISKEYFAKRIDIAYRARFRAVYDGICSRMGKAIGSILQLVFNQFFNTLDIRRASFPYLILASIMLLGWISSIIYLGRKYNKSLENNDWIDMGFKMK